MKPRRSSFRATLDRLTHDFAHAVLDAARQATLGEILELEAAPTAGPHVPAPRGSTAAPARKARRVQRPPTARAPARDAVLAPRPAPALEVPAERDDEPPPSPGTEIDAVAMLASLEGQAAVLEDRPSPLPPILMTVPAADVGPTIALSAAEARAGEEILRTAGGGFVLRRRRRATESAA